MLRRNLRRMVRYPSLTLSLLGMPAIFLLLFVVVLGGTLGGGLGGDRGDYLTYVVPGIVLMTVAGTAQGAAITVAMDMTQGIIARFRTMSIARGAVLTGHVAAAVVQAVVGVAVILGVALALGFRPTAGPLEWLALLGLLAAVVFALTWLCVALGLVASTVESASNLPMPIVLLPFLGSGFVPTDSMPAAVRVFAEHQPFTPIIETIRGLLTGTPIGTSAAVALAWCAVIALGGHLWARRRYDRETR
ncbi:MAG TPA: ABC transporter permease [Pseudonocardiaceae bacterium]